MEYNLSEEQLLDVLKFNAASYSVSIFLVLVPVLVTVLVSIFAIVLSKNLHWKIKTLMLYVVVPEAVSAVAKMLTTLDHIFYFHSLPAAELCRVKNILNILLLNVKMSDSLVYSVGVIIVLRAGLSKLKWKFIILMVVVSIGFVLLSCIAVFFDKPEVSEELRYCLSSSSLVIVQFSILVITGGIYIALTIVFSILSLLYVRQHTIDCKQIEKGTVKCLVLFLTSTFAELMTLVLIGIILAIVSKTDNVWADAVPRVVLFTLGHLAYIIPSLAIMFLVKPVRATVKRFCKCSKKEQN